MSKYVQLQYDFDTGEIVDYEPEPPARPKLKDLDNEFNPKLYLSIYVDGAEKFCGPIWNIKNVFSREEWNEMGEYTVDEFVPYSETWGVQILRLISND